MERVFGDTAKSRSRLELGPGRCLALHLAKRMEGAPLHPGARPNGPLRFLEALPAIGDDDVRSGHARHERRPSL